MTRCLAKFALHSPARRILQMSFLSFLIAASLVSSRAAQTPGREDEIVASLAGGRVILHVAHDVIIFAAMDKPVEVNSVPPRVMQLDGTHVGILLGASEWQVPSDPKPVRLDRDFARIVSEPGQHNPGYDNGEPDLETLGAAFLEKLRPLVGQLHHKLDFHFDEPLFELVIIGFAPNMYGPEIWQVEYRIEQEQIAARGEYWQTRILRPRFTQLYPPEGKKSPRELVEVRYPAGNKEPPLAALIQTGDPRISKLRSSDPRFAKVFEAIERGQAQKANAVDAADFLRAALPLLAGENRFVLGTMEEQRGFDWLVPPDEPVEKITDDKSRPPQAPSLRRRPTP